ncbi:hypothetical protein ACLOJK_006245 [Asimina triloba]
MCRSINNHGISISCKENERLTIRAFCLRLSASNYHTAFPETLTLLYLPRISGAGTLEINDAKIRPASAALVELHRARSAETRRGLLEGDSAEAAFTSTDLVRVRDGVRFEVYVKDEKVVKGVFRRDEEEKEAWKVDCQCVLTDRGLGVSAAEICVSGEGCGVLRGRVEMKVSKKRWGFSGLEEIPEEGESETDGCDCEEEMETGSSTADGGDEEDEEGGEDRMLEMEIEGVRWAVDLGIWVVCLGVGILVSRASPRGLMRTRVRKFV